MTLQAKDIMSTPPVTISGQGTLEQAARLMLERGIGCVLVVDDDGRMQGVLSEGDFCANVGIPFSNLSYPPVLREWMGRDGADRLVKAARERQVTEIMGPPVPAVAPDDSTRQVLELMVDQGVKRLPVVRDGIPAGVITRHDLLRLLKDQPGGMAS